MSVQDHGVDLGRATGHQDLVIWGLCQQDQLCHSHHLARHLCDRDQYLGSVSEYLFEVPPHRFGIGNPIDVGCELDVPFGIGHAQADKSRDVPALTVAGRTKIDMS